MSDLMDVRENDGRYEILTQIEHPSGEERWEPLATQFVRSKLLEAPGGPVYGVSLADELRAEGWLSPEEIGEFKEWQAAAKRVVEIGKTVGTHEDTPFDAHTEWVAALYALERLVVRSEGGFLP